ncbi:MAG: cell division protein FtsQ, partial [Corynebacterium variabile]|nr:cell division protein FtsQ [Corynebacterium variabile]
MARTSRRTRNRKPRPRWLLPTVAAVVVVVIGLVLVSQLLTVKKVQVDGAVNQDSASVQDASGID